MQSLCFKEAKSESELRQVHSLNHRTFAEEIAQHPKHASGLLVDKLDRQNRYFIALRGDRVIGMISAHPGPEFSVTHRFPCCLRLDQFANPFEARLLAIDPSERNRTVLSGLLWQAFHFARSSGGSHLLISAITTREFMYRKLGFVPLGPAMQEGAASFLPMAMDLRVFPPEVELRVQMYERRWRRSSESAEPISLLPGPVAIDPRVAEAFAAAPVSHRGSAFIDRFEQTREQLRGLAPGMDVALFPGAGTLANDVVGANLKAIFGDAPGIVLSNGEFGERLARQATSAGLSFLHLQSAWGAPWSLRDLTSALNRKPAWIWAVHLETSTGVLNDVGGLLALATQGGCDVALDCVSSIGASALPKNVGHLIFASGVSGKSLGSYAGLGFVYLSEGGADRLKGKPLCPSFDLLAMQQARGPVSTVASSSLFALACALDLDYATPTAIDNRLKHYTSLGEHVRQELASAGIHAIAADKDAAPNITSFSLSDEQITQRCGEAGYRIATESSYLRERRWGQIATMGNITVRKLGPLFAKLRASNVST